MKWPFTARDETEHLAEDGAPSTAGPPEAEGLDTDDDVALTDAPASAPSRRRVAALVLLLALGLGVLWWLWGSAGSPAPTTLGPRPDPLLAVRPSAPPRPERPAPPDPVPSVPGSPEREPMPSLSGTPPKSGPTYYRPLPPRPEPVEAAPSADVRQLVASVYEIALKNRETQLAMLEAQLAEQRAKKREAEAREAEARAKIKAAERNPASARRGEGGGGEGFPGPPSSPFRVPPPRGFPGPGTGPLVVPPKGTGPPAAPELDPKASEVFVRMIDTSSEAPEALVTVGPASWVVRIGDPIGAWKVTGIGPTGIWITAEKQRVWRPLLMRTRSTPNPTPSLVAAPASGGHQ